MSKVKRPYGAWPSPVSAAMAASAQPRLGEVKLARDRITWLESRPVEGGRSVPVAAPVSPAGTIAAASDLIGPDVSARNTVHEYGGGSYDIGDEVLVYCNYSDQRIYRTRGGGGDMAYPITPEPGSRHGLRYGDLTLDKSGNRIWCVRESHSKVVDNEIVSIPAEGDDDVTVAVSGCDFYAYPRPSPDGKYLAWITWNHPKMPWDGTEIWLGSIESDGTVTDQRRVGGGSDESIVQPAWSPLGDLAYVSDASGWWNLALLPADSVNSHMRDEAGGAHPKAITPKRLAPGNAEFAGPLWVLGTSTFAFLGPRHIAAAFHSGDRTRLLVVDVESGEAQKIETDYRSFDSLASDGAGRLAFVGAGPLNPPAVAVVELLTEHGEVIRTPHRAVISNRPELPLPGESVSVAQPLEFETTDGDTARAWFYPPVSAVAEAPAGDIAPLITMSHGGPTAATSTDFRLDVQFWTSRGFGIVDVDYRGSTGYGRQYRNRLNGKWGIYDVDDCVAAAEHLISTGLADPARIAIRGRSAGGYTTLCALAFTDTFAGGASYYGIADAEILAKETHKFESHYLDGLIGPYPEAAETYRSRSPIHFAGRLSCPVIFFQGLEDEVVPPDQAEMMVAALKARGLPHAYVPFAGEQHGFRSAKNIEAALAAECSFYLQVFEIPIAAEDLPGDPITLWSP